MMNFKYHVNAYFNEAETTLRTNNIRIAIHEFFEYVEDGIKCDILDGTTGEVLAIANNPEMENYATEEMALMMLGCLMEDAWGEAEAEEAECVDCEHDEPACRMCGGTLDEHGVCEYCGVVNEYTNLPGKPIYPGSGIRCMVCGQGKDPLTELLNALVADGQAIKLPS